MLVTYSHMALFKSIYFHYAVSLSKSYHHGTYLKICLMNIVIKRKLHIHNYNLYVVIHLPSYDK